MSQEEQFDIHLLELDAGIIKAKFKRAKGSRKKIEQTISDQELESLQEGLKRERAS